AHNASIVDAYLEHRGLAEAESEAERFFMNVSLGRVLPDRYPLAQDVQRYIAAEHRMGRMLDYAVIVPRLQRLYEWSAEELGEPRLLGLVRDGSPIYAWPFEERRGWASPAMAVAARILESATRAR